jgi:hypothetical protein
MTPLQAVVQTGGFRPTAKMDSVLLLTPAKAASSPPRAWTWSRSSRTAFPERVRLHPGDVVYVPTTWIADMNIVVDQYVRGLIPALPRCGRRLLALRQLRSISMATLQTLPENTTLITSSADRGGTSALAIRTFLYAVFKHQRLVLGIFLLVFLGSARARRSSATASGSRRARCS